MLTVYQFSYHKVNYRGTSRGLYFLSGNVFRNKRIISDQVLLAREIMNISCSLLH